MQYRILGSKKRISFLLSFLVTAASFSSISSARADGVGGIVLSNPRILTESPMQAEFPDTVAVCSVEFTEPAWFYSVAYLASEFGLDLPSVSDIVNPQSSAIDFLRADISYLLPGASVAWIADPLTPKTSYRIYSVMIDSLNFGYDPSVDEASNIVVCDYTTMGPPPVLSPEDGGTVSTDEYLYIDFDEPVRNSDGTELTSGDLAALITFKKTDNTGDPVAFTATINAEKTRITIIPTSELIRNEVYFYAMGPVVEGFTGIPISGFQATFTARPYDLNRGIYVRGAGACWLWQFAIGEDGDLTSSIEDAFILDTCIEGQESRLILGDLYDSFGRGSVNGRGFNWENTNEFDGDGLLIGNKLVIPGEEEEVTEDSTYTITFADNNVTYEIVTPFSRNLLISGRLGSNQETTFVTLGNRNFSYQEDLETLLPHSDPILLWETNGALVKSAGEEELVNGHDEVEVSINGNFLQLKHYAYAYRTTGFTSSIEFFDSFLKFVNEDKSRTDVFSIDYGKAKAKPSAPARQTYNLSFEQSFHGSDYLADPKGEIRSILNVIEKKYGNLISIK
jgi:hypothetical protein